MFGSSFPVRIVTSLTVIAFSLLTAGLADAQTAATAVEKPIAELTAAPAKPATSAVAPAEEAKAKPATESPKAEGDSAKTETTLAAPASPAATTTTPAKPAPATEREDKSVRNRRAEAIEHERFRNCDDVGCHRARALLHDGRSGGRFRGCGGCCRGACRRCERRFSFCGVPFGLRRLGCWFRLCFFGGRDCACRRFRWCGS